jgi:hypothetical protein
MVGAGPDLFELELVVGLLAGVEDPGPGRVAGRKDDVSVFDRCLADEGAIDAIEEQFSVSHGVCLKGVGRSGPFRFRLAC